MSAAPIVIVSPALAASNNGNWRTASRWRAFLRTYAPAIVQHWAGEPALAMIALHARRSAESIARFREACPQAPLALLLTGTDLYEDLARDRAAQHSLQCASHLVVLQQEALQRLGVADRARTRVIVQSATRVACHGAGDRAAADFVAVGHLRAEKDPLTLMRAARQVRGDGIRILHIGGALDAALGEEARRTMASCSNYRWVGALARRSARQRIACSRALIHMSRVEGGANVVIEAVRSGVAVLASRIDGNVGLLGHGYDGYFPPGNAAALALLMRRMLAEPAYTQRLRAQCAARDALFAPAAERAAVRQLVFDMLARSIPAAIQ